MSLVPLLTAQYASVANASLANYSAFRSAVLADGGTIYDESYSFGLFVEFFERNGIQGLGATLITGMPASKVSVLYGWGVQNQTLVSFAFARAGTKWTLRKNGNLEEWQANFPAFEWNADGTYRGVSAEPGATNLHTGYTLTGGGFASQTVNNELSATNFMLTCVENTASSARERFANITTASNYVVSTIYKDIPATRYVKLLGSTVGAGTFVGATFGHGGVIIAQSVANTARVTSLGNGYYLAEVTVTPADGVAHDTFVRVTDTTSTSPTAGATFTGTGETYIIGAHQLGEGSVATSRIFVNGSTASRLADSITLTGAGSLIGQSAGTLLVEASVANLSTVSFGRILEVGTNVNNRISIMANAGAVRGFITTEGVDTQGGVMNEFVANNTVFRAALAYQVGAGLGALYVNGTGDITSPTAVPASSISSIGSSITAAFGCVSHIRSVALFPTRLTNAQLQALTTP